MLSIGSGCIFFYDWELTNPSLVAGRNNCSNFNLVRTSFVLDYIKLKKKDDKKYSGIIMDPLAFTTYSQINFYHFY